jgi:hypothetical protein
MLTKQEAHETAKRLSSDYIVRQYFTILIDEIYFEQCHFPKSGYDILESKEMTKWCSKQNVEFKEPLMSNDDDTLICMMSQFLARYLLPRDAM